MLNTVNIQLDFNLLLSMVEQCDIKQKKSIFKALVKDLKKENKDEFLKDFEQSLKEVKQNKTKPLKDLFNDK